MDHRYRCPNCGRTDQLYVRVTTLARLLDNKPDALPTIDLSGKVIGDFAWDAMECGACDYGRGHFLRRVGEFGQWAGVDRVHHIRRLGLSHAANLRLVQAMRTLAGATSEHYARYPMRLPLRIGILCRSTRSQLAAQGVGKGVLQALVAALARHGFALKEE